VAGPAASPWAPLGCRACPPPRLLRLPLRSTGMVMGWQWGSSALLLGHGLCPAGPLEPALLHEN